MRKKRLGCLDVAVYVTYDDCHFVSSMASPGNETTE
jgi:hypothetical protein